MTHTSANLVEVCSTRQLHGGKNEYTGEHSYAPQASVAGVRKNSSGFSAVVFFQLMLQGTAIKYLIQSA